MPIWLKVPKYYIQKQKVKIINKLILFIINIQILAEELSYELYYLSNNERELGFHLDLECNKLFEQKKKDISFYLSLPNMSIINCLYLAKNFENISKFCNW